MLTLSIPFSQAFNRAAVSMRLCQCVCVQRRTSKTLSLQTSWIIRSDGTWRRNVSCCVSGVVMFVHSLKVCVFLHAQGLSVPTQVQKRVWLRHLQCRLHCCASFLWRPFRLGHRSPPPDPTHVLDAACCFPDWVRVGCGFQFRWDVLTGARTTHRHTLTHASVFGDGTLCAIARRDHRAQVFALNWLL